MNLLDRIAASFRPRPVQAPTDTRNIYRETALTRTLDWYVGLPDPDEVLRRTGRTRANLRELERDDELTQALDTRRDAVVATPWRLEPNQGRAARFLADVIRECMPTMIEAAWSAVPYGYSVAEVVYDRLPSGRVGIASLQEKPYEWFKPMPGGGLRYFPDDGSGGVEGLEADLRKFMLTVRRPTYRNPYGEALLSRLYWPVTWRIQGWRQWLEFLDTFGAPIVIGQVNNYDEFIKAMKAQGVRSAVGFQSTGQDEKITTVSASTPGEFERLENALVKRMQKLILGQTLTSDIGDKGSYAAAKVHDDVREDKRRSDIRLVSRACQRLVDTLAALNGMQPPEFVMQDDAGLELSRAERDGKLAPVLKEHGFRLTRNYFTDRYDLDEEDLEDAPAAVPAPPIEDPELSARLGLRSRKRTFSPGQQAVEDLIDDATGEAPDGPIPVESIRAAVRAAADEDDLRRRLAQLLDEQDPHFGAVLERAQFAALVLGYVAADENTA